MSVVPAFLAERLDDFTGRAWLLDPIIDWLTGSARKRFFLLTGRPGTGKSMVAAWLSGAGPSPTETGARTKLVRLRSCVGATHFCGGGGGNKDPKTAAGAIAAQLEEKVVGFRETVLASVDSSARVHVNFQVGTAQPGSSVVGLVIGNLGNLSGEIAFNRLLRDPLKSVYEKGYKERMLLIVDSLDEAETFSGDVRIPYLISSLIDLPPEVSILVTTRQDERILQYFPSASTRMFDLVENAPAEVDDIRLFAEQRLTKLEGIAGARLAKEISANAQGVFLYASLILPELIAAVQQGGDPSGVSLPQGLTELYRMFLGRELTRDKDKWFNVYGPLLGVLAVAQGNGLEREQLERVCGGEVGGALLSSRQYLVGDTPRGPFRIFHQSFVEFLFDEAALGSFRIDPREMHQRVAESYAKEYRSRWNAIDAYGADYLLSHILEADVKGKLAQIHGDSYATRHLFFHLVRAGLADEIGNLVARVCHGQ